MVIKFQFSIDTLGIYHDCEDLYNNNWGESELICHLDFFPNR